MFWTSRKLVCHLPSLSPMFIKRGRQAEDPWNHPQQRADIENHVNEVVKAYNFHMRALHHLRRTLTCDVTNTLACSIVGSESITVMLCCSAPPIRSSIRFNAYRTIWRGSWTKSAYGSCTSRDSTHMTFCDLHWLPIWSQIKYKVSVLATKATI